MLKFARCILLEIYANRMTAVSALLQVYRLIQLDINVVIMVLMMNYFDELSITMHLYNF